MSFSSTGIPEGDRQNAQFAKYFCSVATNQARWAYLFMSIHAVNPRVFARITDFNPYPILYANMIYGTAIMIYNRPAMRPLKQLYRGIFCILGSLMFNNSSLLVFNWLVTKFSHRPRLLTFLGYLTGRLMISYFLAYLYHVDLRFLTSRDIHRLDSRYDRLYG